jgi:hypothetical protein
MDEMNYSALAEREGLYALFVGSKEFKDALYRIEEISPSVSHDIGIWGIGEQVLEDGQYDFESGQLLDSVPKSVRGGEEWEDAHDSICELARAYAQYVVDYGKG